MIAERGVEGLPQSRLSFKMLSTMALMKSAKMNTSEQPMTVCNSLRITMIALLVTACATSMERGLDTVPMYGQPNLPRSESLKKADAEFVAGAISACNGDRELASNTWAKEGDTFLQRGDLDYAIRRYNQAWLINDQSYVPYWGFGQVMMVREKYDEAIKFYEKAKLLIQDKPQKPALLTDLGLSYSFKARSTGDQKLRENYFRAANQYFEESSMLGTKYPILWEAWANSLYREKRYADAWSKVKKARELGQAVQPQFLERLRQAMPEPK
jgi:tetratricopeptide (TPR) repeat protein